MNIRRFTFSAVDGRVSCFLIWATEGRAPADVLAHPLRYVCLCLSVECVPGLTLLGRGAVTGSALSGCGRTSKVAAAALPCPRPCGPRGPASSPALAVAGRFHCAVLVAMRLYLVVVSICIFLMVSETEHFFYTFIGHLDILFCEVPTCVDLSSIFFLVSFPECLCCNPSFYLKFL